MRRSAVSGLLSLAVVAALALASTWYLVVGVAKVSWFDDRMSVTMVIPDAANIVPRSPIELSGVRVGEVTSVDNTGDGVRVVFEVDESARIPLSSNVRIEALSALSEPYVNFMPTSSEGPYIRPGTVLDGQRITTPASIPEVAMNATSVLGQLDPMSLKSLVTTFSEALETSDAALPQLSRAGDLLAATLLSRSGRIREILRYAQVPGPDVARAGRQMIASGPELADFGARVKSVVDSMEVLLKARPVPEAYTTGMGIVQFLPKLNDYFERIGPDLRTLYPVIGPLIGRGADALKVADIDLSALISQALASVSPDGVVRLQVSAREGAPSATTPITMGDHLATRERH